MGFSRSDVCVLCICAAVLLAGAVWLGRAHAENQRRALTGAVNRQIAGHKERIAEVLTIRGTNYAVMEQAIYEELQTAPSSSLITRSMVGVKRGKDGRLECRIDISSLGLKPRTITSRD